MHKYGFMSLALLLSSSQMTADVLDKTFPYGEAPQGDVCVSSDNYATPESMLGSWAMLKAVDNDIATGVLPVFLQSKGNVVYGVGTAAIGDALGIANCSGGCNQLNGFCFALRFNNKSAAPRYMIFQSVNIAANNNSFDIYMAGGGAGAFPDFCAKFWGGNTVNWSANILNFQSCDDYFKNANFTTTYSVTSGGVKYSAIDTLKNACQFGISSGFNRQNFSDVSVVPVTCPDSLTQITGVRLNSTGKVGNKDIVSLSALTEADFDSKGFIVPETTQMQDCKTPSSGYCNNVSNTVSNYQASISASLTAPLLSGQASSGSGNWCAENPGSPGYCSWDNGKSSGGEYCNQSESVCLGCGNSSKWFPCTQ